jgi:hypothetical protein
MPVSVVSPVIEMNQDVNHRPGQGAFICIGENVVGESGGEMGVIDSRRSPDADRGWTNLALVQDFHFAEPR